MRSLFIIILPPKLTGYSDGMKGRSSILFMVNFITGCSNKVYHIKNIVELKDEQPTSIIIRFDDPSIEPRIIEAKDDIDLIICSLTELTYKKIKSNSPAPLGNTYFELNYSDGSKLELGAVYVKGLHGDLYQAESMEFAALLDSYRK